MPTIGVTVAKLGQKNSGKKPSAGEEQVKEAALMEAIKAAYEKANEAKTEQKNSGKKPSVKEEQAKEAALKKDAVYQQKIAAWKRSTQDKANDAKAAEEADDKKAEEKAARIKAARKKAALK